MLFASLRGYRAAWLSADLVSGTLLAAISIPAMIATARLAGMPPETGLVAFIAGTLALAIFGVSRVLTVGADSTIAPIFAVTIAAFAASGSREYALLVGLVALFVGALLVIAGAIHAEWVSDLLSVPVTIGFLAGIAIQIVISQLPALLGVTVSATGAIPRLAAVLHVLPKTNLAALAFGLGVLAVILATKRLDAKIPSAVIALVAGGGVVAIFHLQHRLAMVGTLQAVIPRLSLPIPGDAHWERILPLSIVVAVVCTVQTVTTLRTFRTEKGIVDPSRDLAATGAGSILAALCGSFAVDASPPRTAIAQSTGARSQLAGIVAIVWTILFMLFGAGLTAWIPEAALAAILIFISIGIFRLSEMVRIARESRLEIVLVAIPAALVILLPINTGVMLSILLSLLYGVYVMLRPPAVELVHVPGTTIWWPPSRQEKGDRERGIVVFSPAAPLYFMNVRYIVERLNAAVLAAPEPVRLLVIEGSGIIDIDYTGAHVFRSAIEALRGQKIEVALARLSEERAQTAAERTGLLALVGSEHTFKSAQEAVDALSRR